MAFRKRNIGVNRTAVTPENAENNSPSLPTAPARGVRPSPLTGQPTTSTGTQTLDAQLGGHAGLALGSALLIEESGTTDFAGALLRYYAAEGLVQGHVLHIVGVGEQWVKELPALVGPVDAASERGERREKSGGRAAQERMKIAWRYERLGEVGSRALPDRSHPTKPSPDSDAPDTAFCHVFDLAKRLDVPSDASINHISLNPASFISTNPFTPILQSLQYHLLNSQSRTIHRLIIPTLLSPALYPPHANNPQHFLQFLHALRALLRQHPTQLTALLTLPLSLYPRTSALVRWAEILSDGLIELTPFPHLMDASNGSSTESGGARGAEDQPQGMLRIHKLPVNSEGGEGGAAAGMGEDLAFTVSRRKFVIRPFSLPPIEGDTQAQAEAEGGMPRKADIEF